MKCNKLNAFFIFLAACFQLTLLIFSIYLLISRVEIIHLPIGEECFYPRTVISDHYIESSRPVLYVNPIPTSEKLEADDFLLSLILTDVQVKAKTPGIKYLKLHHYKPEKSRKSHYFFIVY